MRRHLASGVAAILMAGPMVAGCETAPPPPPPSIEWQQPFDSLTDYWKARGLGDLGLHLVVVTGDTAFSCGEEQATSDRTGAYCAEKKTVIVGEGRFQQLMTLFVAQGGDPEQARRIVLGHEIGHGLEHIIYGGPTLARSKDNELMADCLAGEAIDGLDKDKTNLSQAEKFYTIVGPGKDNGASHGTPAERIQSFESGSAKDELGNNYGCGLRGYATFQGGRIVAGI